MLGCPAGDKAIVLHKRCATKDAPAPNPLVSCVNEDMTSDHRVAGSSPAGCKPSLQTRLAVQFKALRIGLKIDYLPKFCHFFGEPPALNDSRTKRCGCAFA